MDKAHKKTVTIAACQLPDVREEIADALSYINKYAAKAALQGAALLCFPECFLQGYLVEEAPARAHALDLDSPAFKQLLEQLPGTGPMLVIGMIELAQGRLFNTAIVVHGRKLIGRYRKTYLLSGEAIVFDAGDSYPVFEAGGLRFGINICYDTNFSEAAAALAQQGAGLIVCPANNMMRREKAEKFKHVHNEVRAQRAKETGLWLISSDVMGERDDKISYGTTAVIDPHGRVVSQAPLMEEGMVIAEITHNAPAFQTPGPPASPVLR